MKFSFSAMPRLLSAVTLLFVLLSSLPSSAVAGVNPAGPCHVADCNRQATVFMENQYDTLVANHTGSTVASINQYLVSGKLTAQKWRSDIFLVSFDLLYEPGSTDSINFLWASPSEKNLVFRTTPPINPGGIGFEEALEQETRFNGIFKVPMRLRDLMKAMLEDPKLLPMLNTLYQGDNIEESLYSARFHLEKNAANRLTWTVTFFSKSGEKTYKVMVSAEKTENPVFTVLHKI